MVTPSFHLTVLRACRPSWMNASLAILSLLLWPRAPAARTLMGPQAKEPALSPCPPCFQRWPGGSAPPGGGACLPDAMVAFLTCFQSTNAGSIPIRVEEEKDAASGTHTNLTIDGKVLFRLGVGGSFDRELSQQSRVIEKLKKLYPDFAQHCSDVARAAQVVRTRCDSARPRPPRIHCADGAVVIPGPGRVAVRLRDPWPGAALLPAYVDITEGQRTRSEAIAAGWTVQLDGPSEIRAAGCSSSAAAPTCGSNDRWSCRATDSLIYLRPPSSARNRVELTMTVTSLGATSSAMPCAGRQPTVSAIGDRPLVDFSREDIAHAHQGCISWAKQSAPGWSVDVQLSDGFYRVQCTCL